MSKGRITGQPLKHRQKEESLNKDEPLFLSLLEHSKKLAVTFVLVLALLFALFVAVHLIPTEKLIKNAYDSSLA